VRANRGYNLEVLLCLLPTSCSDLALGTVRPRSKKAANQSGLFKESQLQASSSITSVPLSAVAADSLQGRFVIVVVVRADDLRST
jgi:hypothetical protein